MSELIRIKHFRKYEGFNINIDSLFNKEHK